MKHALAWLLAASSLGCGDEVTTSSSGASSGAATSGASGTAGATATTASGATTGTGSGGAAPVCPACAEPTDAAVVASPDIVEASGIVASAVHPGVLYAHNDSGDSARFFAIGAQGEDLGSYVLSGASATDWEDIARGPCQSANESCLYLADVGDNNQVRSSYTIHRVVEPAALAAGVNAVAHETFTFQYPDGSHNCEAILVHPATGTITLVTKDRAGPQAYELAAPLAAGPTLTATGPTEVVLGDLLPLVTGGDIHPRGTAVLLRTYTSVWSYPMVPGQAAAEALAGGPCELPAAGEQQGEAIGWARSGATYFTLSEGASETVHAVSCR